MQCDPRQIQPVFSCLQRLPRQTTFYTIAGGPSSKTASMPCRRRPTFLYEAHQALLCWQVLSLCLVSHSPPLHAALTPLPFVPTRFVPTAWLLEAEVPLHTRINSQAE